MSKAMTLDTLLNRAAAKERAKDDKLEIQLPGSENVLIFHRLSDAKILEIVDQIASGAKDAMLTGAMEATDHMIYASCELLQNPELHAQLGVAEPWDVVPKIFTLAERNEIGGKLFAWLGVDAIAGDVKNA
ncbi:MAG: hypothetical protein Q4D42_03045 [Eubacteriales bacterium]|nr:hypothetical protein [Eubacteriales bacterium]